MNPSACFVKQFKETYGLHCPRCGFVKFGGSDHTEERIRRISAEHRRECRGKLPAPAAWPLALLGTFKKNQQKSLREKFGLWRIKHEWFVYTDEIRRYLMEHGWPNHHAGAKSDGRIYYPTVLPDLPAWPPEQWRAITDRLRRRQEHGKIP
jgi:hypothetical protein